MCQSTCFIGVYTMFPIIEIIRYTSSVEKYYNLNIFLSCSIYIYIYILYNIYLCVFMYIRICMFVYIQKRGVSLMISMLLLFTVRDFRPQKQTKQKQQEAKNYKQTNNPTIFPTQSHTHKLTKQATKNIK